MRARAQRGRRRRSPGACSPCPRRRSGRSVTSTGSTSWSSAAGRRTSPPGSPGAARGRSASTSRPPSSRPRDAARRRPALVFPLVEASAEDVPLASESFDLAVSEYGASIWCDPHRWLPEAYRLLRPGGRLWFLRNSTLSILCAPDEEAAPGRTLLRPQRGLGRMEWPGEVGVEWQLPHGELFRLLRAHRLRRRRPRRAVRARTTRPTTSTTRRSPPTGRGSWPAEEIWVAAKPLVTHRARPRVDLAAASRDPRAARGSRSTPSRRATSSTTRPTPTPSRSCATHALGKARSVHDGRDARRSASTRRCTSGSGSTRSRADEDDARAMLRELAGRTHAVVSGALPDHRPRRDASSTPRRSSRSVRSTTRAIDRYAASGEWEGRAGGYAIQGLGGRLVERIEGDYLNVVGLPGALLLRTAREARSRRCFV